MSDTKRLHSLIHRNDIIIIHINNGKGTETEQLKVNLIYSQYNDYPTTVGKCQIDVDNEK